jgi:hypothetical protein
MADILVTEANDKAVKIRWIDQGDGTFAQLVGSRPHASSAIGGIPSVARLLSAASSTNATLVKATAGRLYKVQGYNAAAAVRYIKLYNKATAPTVGTDTPAVTLALGPSAAFTLDLSNIGLYFATGIGFGLTVNSADADTTALTAGDVVGMNLFYA